MESSKSKTENIEQEIYKFVPPSPKDNCYSQPMLSIHSPIIQKDVFVLSLFSQFISLPNKKLQKTSVAMHSLPFSAMIPSDEI
jgi:hypothetical protein